MRILLIILAFFSLYLPLPLVAEGVFSELDLSGSSTLGADSFRSIPDGTWQNNNGAFLAVNLAQKIARIPGVGVQVGSSFGLYDWSGRGSTDVSNNKELQQQIFLTTGVFAKTPYSSGFNWGVVSDYMWNKKFSVFGLNSNMGQFRAQAGYLFCCTDEIGAWGTIGYGSYHANLSGIPIRFKAINQANLYWAHHFENRAYTMVSFGIPYGRSLFFNSGRPGRCLFGGRFSAPLSQCWSLTGHFAYMSPRHASGSSSTSEVNAYNVTLGLTYSFGGKSCLQPYMPLADNSNFLVDTNLSD